MVDWAGRVIVGLFGYSCAVFIAVWMSLLMLDSPWSVVTVRHDVDWRLTFLPALMVTFVTALPGFLLALLFSTAMWQPNWLYFSLAGLLNVMLAIWLFSFGGRLFGTTAETINFALHCMPGGFLGGLTFWLVAYRLEKGQQERSS